MVKMVKELTRLKGQSGSDDDGTEMLTKLLAQAKQLQLSKMESRSGRPTACRPTAHGVAQRSPHRLSFHA